MNNKITLHRIHRTSADLENENLQIQEGLIPLLLIPDLIVKRNEPVSLGQLDMFLIEAALKLGEVSSEDLEQIADLPSVSSYMLLRRLSSKGILQENAPGIFIPVDKKAKEALESGVSYEEVSDTETFLFLPLTEELYSSKISARDLKKVKPTNSYLLPISMERIDLTQYIDEKIKSGTVVGLRSPLIGVSDENDAILAPEVCPCYRFEGKFADEDYSLRLRLLSEDSRRNEASGNESGDGHSRNTDRYGVNIVLRNAKSILERWDFREDVVQLLMNEEIWEGTGLEGKAPKSVDRQGSMYACMLSYPSLKKFSEKCLLTEVIGILAECDGCRLNLGIKLVPSTAKQAQSLYLLDAVLSTIKGNFSLIDANSISQIVTQVVADNAYMKASDALVIREDTLLNRAWELGEYLLVYKLREKGDFCYA